MGFGQAEYAALISDLRREAKAVGWETWAPAQNPMPLPDGSELRFVRDEDGEGWVATRYVAGKPTNKGTQI